MSHFSCLNLHILSLGLEPWSLDFGLIISLCQAEKMRNSNGVSAYAGGCAPFALAQQDLGVWDYRARRIYHREVNSGARRIVLCLRSTLGRGWRKNRSQAHCSRENCASNARHPPDRCLQTARAILRQDGSIGAAVEADAQPSFMAANKPLGLAPGHLGKVIDIQTAFGTVPDAAISYHPLPVRGAQSSNMNVLKYRQRSGIHTEFSSHRTAGNPKLASKLPRCQDRQGYSSVFLGFSVACPQDESRRRRMPPW